MTEGIAMSIQVWREPLSDAWLWTATTPLGTEQGVAESKHAAYGFAEAAQSRMLDDWRRQRLRLAEQLEDDES